MINIKDVTFIIPVKIDSLQRQNNLDFVIWYLTSHFDTNIYIIESDKQPILFSRYKKEIKYLFEKIETGIFYRTALLNLATDVCNTKYVCIYDTDVFFNINQYVDSINLLRHGIDVVYPYNKIFYDVPEKYSKIRDLKFEPKNIAIKELRLLNNNSVGGAFFINKEKYIKAGKENKRFVSWGFEDNERFERFTKLGYIVQFVDGYCYHLTHSRDMNSSDLNPFIKSNEMEFEKIKLMNKYQLINYIKTW